MQTRMGRVLPGKECALIGAVFFTAPINGQHVGRGKKHDSAKRAAGERGGARAADH